MIGPDFRLRPVDKLHPGFGTLPWEGFYSRLDTADVLGDDLSDSIIFEHGLGQDSAENVVHEPDGDLVRNHFTQVYPGGQRNSRGRHTAGPSRQNLASMVDYGVMEGLESSGQRDKQTVLQEKARAMVKAYARSPNYFHCHPPHQPAPACPPTAPITTSGTSSAPAPAKATGDVDLVGRIITSTLNAIDQAGNTRVELECVPSILVDLEPDD